MKANRVWVEIVIVGTMIACALALLIATLGAAAGAAAGAAESQQLKTNPTQTLQSTTEQSYQGMVTCSRCGAKHSAAIGKAASDCVRACVHGGAAFALVDGDETYLLDGDSIALKRVAGQRAHVIGAISGKTIRVSSVDAI